MNEWVKVQLPKREHGLLVYKLCINICKMISFLNKDNRYLLSLVKVLKLCIKFGEELKMWLISQTTQKIKTKKNNLWDMSLHHFFLIKWINLTPSTPCRHFDRTLNIKEKNIGSIWKTLYCYISKTLTNISKGFMIKLLNEQSYWQSRWNFFT